MSCWFLHLCEHTDSKEKPPVVLWYMINQPSLQILALWQISCSQLSSAPIWIPAGPTPDQPCLCAFSFSVLYHKLNDVTSALWLKDRRNVGTKPPPGWPRTQGEMSPKTLLALQTFQRHLSEITLTTNYNQIMTLLPQMGWKNVVGNELILYLSTKLINKIYLFVCLLCWKIISWTTGWISMKLFVCNPQQVIFQRQHSFRWLLQLSSFG